MFYIPAEIVEEIIDNVQDLDDVESLRNLALTSHFSLPRSRYHLLSWHVCLNSITKLHSFCDFLDTHPGRRPWVRSVTISQTKESPFFHDVVPMRLLANHPNLYRCVIIKNRSLSRPRIFSNPRKLQGLRQYTQAITHLHLDRISFQSGTAFIQYILAFPGLRHLRCEMLEFQQKDSDAALVRARERPSNQLQLSHLTIHGMPGVAATLLLELSQHALQELVIDVSKYADPKSDVKLPTLIPHLSKLSSITLRAEVFSDAAPADKIIQYAVEVFQALASNPKSHITHIAIHLSDRHISNILEYLQKHSDDLLHTCRTLETALLRLPRLQKIELYHHLRRPLHKWTPVRLEHNLPTLHKRGLIDARCLAPPVQSHSDAVSALAVSSNGKWVASGSDDTTIILWDARHGTVVHEWPAHSKAVTSLAFSRDGRYLVSASSDRRVVVWDVGEGAVQEARLVTTLEEVNHCVWSSDGTILALGCREGISHVWNPSTSEVQPRSLEGYVKGNVRTAILSPNGRWIVLQGTGNCWNVWDAKTGALHKVLPGVTDPYLWIECVFDPAGRCVVIPSDDHSARIWDVETGDELAVLEGFTHKKFCNTAFSPDGTRVLSTTSDDGTMILWDSFSGDTVLSFQALGDEHTTQQVCFSPDGKYVASTANDHRVRLWRASDGLCTRRFAEHDGPVRWVVFSPDGEALVSGGYDGKVCIRRLGEP